MQNILHRKLDTDAQEQCRDQDMSNLEKHSDRAALPPASSSFPHILGLTPKMNTPITLEFL